MTHMRVAALGVNDGKELHYQGGAGRHHRWRLL